MINLQFGSINFYSIIVAWIIHTSTGLIWFHHKLFGKEWSKLTGKELKPASKWIIPGFLGHFIMILVLALLIKFTNANSGSSGLVIGLLIWIGFIVPMEIGELVWEKIPFRLFLLRIGNQFVGLCISGFILGAWQ
jgi:hypothetical protein